MRYLWSMVDFIFVSLVWNSSLFLDLYINGDKIYFYKLDHIMDTDEALVYDGKHYHCDGCLLDHLVGNVEKVQINL